MQTVNLDGPAGNIHSLINIGMDAKRQIGESRKEQVAFRERMLKNDSYKAIIEAFLAEFSFLFVLIKNGEEVTKENINDLF